MINLNQQDYAVIYIISYKESNMECWLIKDHPYYSTLYRNNHTKTWYGGYNLEKLGIYCTYRSIWQNDYARDCNSLYVGLIPTMDSR